MIYSDIIKMLRKERKLSQSELGEHIGVSGPAVSKWEIMKAEPDINAILKLCDLFDVSADYLLGRTEWPGFVWRDADGNPRDIHSEIEEPVMLSKADAERLRAMLDERARMEKKPAG